MWHTLKEKKNCLVKSKVAFADNDLLAHMPSRRDFEYSDFIPDRVERPSPQKVVGWLCGFYGISTFEGYLTLNSFLSK